MAVLSTLDTIHADNLALLAALQQLHTDLVALNLNVQLSNLMVATKLDRAHAHRGERIGDYPLT